MMRLRRHYRLLQCEDVSEVRDCIYRDSYLRINVLDEAMVNEKL